MGNLRRQVSDSAVESRVVRRCLEIAAGMGVPLLVAHALYLGSVWLCAHIQDECSNPNEDKPCHCSVKYITWFPLLVHEFIGNTLTYVGFTFGLFYFVARERVPRLRTAI